LSVFGGRADGLFFFLFADGRGLIFLPIGAFDGADDVEEDVEEDVVVDNTGTISAS
jgi:hypothetical protein